MDIYEWMRLDDPVRLKEAFETGLIDPNAKDILGNSLMHTAGTMDAWRSIPVLVEFMREPWEIDGNMGWVPIMNAVWNDRYKAAEAMLPYLDHQSVRKASIAAKARNKADMGLWLISRWEALAIEKQTAPGQGAVAGRARL